MTVRAVAGLLLAIIIVILICIFVPGFRQVFGF